jgi:hypothetical protein
MAGVSQALTFFAVSAGTGSGAAKALLLGVTTAWAKPAMERAVSRMTPRKMTVAAWSALLPSSLKP